MKTFTSMIRQNSARRILIFGLLAGLFFSSGEGVQLMPFPVSDTDCSKIAATDNSDISASAIEENSKSYAFSVFSSRGISAFLKTKFQKHANQYLSGEHFAFERSEAGAKYSLQSVQTRREPDFRHVSQIADSRSDRAPPAV